MTEPQTWAMLGVFTTIMLGGMTLMTTLINRSTTNAIAALHGELGGRISALEGEVRGLRGEMDARFDAVDARFNAVDARFNAVDTRIDHLDRDVSVIMRRMWGEPQGE